ncbi:MAG: sulfur reduction protein DsrE [Nitrospiraceae bacterium]|nr:MAG: sulfur reduction protein DsrE [Nitrospiraceae bacterium]
MKTKSKIMKKCLLVSLCLLFISAGTVPAEEYKALNGLTSVKAIFDFRIGDPKSAAAHLDLIYQTFQDKSIRAITEKPEFVIAFIGPSVKLISSKQEGFSPEDQKVMHEIADKVTKMSKDGIKMEVCIFAAKFLGVDPATILPEITHVGNGWISLIGYQARGYSIVPAY